MMTRCNCAECIALDNLPERLQGWAGAYQLALLPMGIFESYIKGDEKSESQPLDTCMPNDDLQEGLGF